MAQQVKSYFKIAWRNLANNKVSTFINILGLSLGITACLVIYLIVSFELSFEDFHPEKERIYRVVSTSDNFSGGKYFMSQIPHAGLMILRANFRGIENSATLYGYYAQVTIPAKAEHKKFDAPPWPFTDIVATEPQYFQIFTYQWLAGNPHKALDQPFKVVLTESRARKYFGQIPLNDIVGKEVDYNDSLHLTVSGIIRDLGSNSDLVFKDFISFSTIPNSFLKDVNEFSNARPGNWGWADNSQIFIKLAKGITPAQFEAQAAPMIKEHMKLDRGRKVWIGLQPLSDIHFNPDFRDFYSRETHLPTLYGLIGIAGFILVIACINFINLSTAQSMRRAKEIGIRKVLGSSRASIVWQFLCESFTITLIALVLSMGIVTAILNAFRAIIPPGVAFRPLEPLTLAFLLIVAIITALLAGYYPGKVLSSLLPVESIKGQSAPHADRRNYLRKSLIVFQFSVSVFFIIGAMVIGDQIHYVLTKDLGFTKDAIVNINTSGGYPADSRNVLAAKIRQLSGVASVTVCTEPPIRPRPRGGLLVCEDKGTKVENAIERVGDEHYVPVFGLQILAGRNFNVPIGQDSLTEFLISKMCARQFGFSNPEAAIGHRIMAGYYDNSNQFHAWNAGPVVGIVADFNTEPLHAAMSPIYIFVSKRLSWGILSVRLSTRGNQQVGHFKATMTGIEMLWKEVYPNETFNYRFLDDTVAGYYDKERKLSQIVNSAMAVAILISCMGLFGLATFTAQQRIKEIGIRKALGASIAGIVTMLSRDMVKLVFLSFVLASPVAWYAMNRWLDEFAYRVKISWLIFALAGATAILIALITACFQATKAAIANPLKSLRTP